MYRLHTSLQQAHIFLMRGSEGMVRGHPGLLPFVPLEHGEIRNPQKPVIDSRIASFLENSVLVGILLRQRQSQQSRGRVNREFRRSYFAVGGHRGLRPSLRRSSDKYE